MQAGGGGCPRRPRGCPVGGWLVTNGALLLDSRICFVGDHVSENVLEEATARCSGDVFDSCSKFTQVVQFSVYECVVCTRIEFTDERGSIVERNGFKISRHATSLILEVALQCIMLLRPKLPREVFEQARGEFVNYRH